MAEENQIKTGDALATFLFELMRDHLVPGLLEQTVVALEKSIGTRGTLFTASAHHLGRYAMDLANRIRACDVAEPMLRIDDLDVESDPDPEQATPPPA